MDITGDRIQVRLRPDTGAELDRIVELSQRSGVLPRCANTTDLVRFALRILRFCAGKSCELRNGQASQKLLLHGLAGAATLAKDLHLDAQDRAHLDYLQREEHFPSRSATVRAVIDTYIGLAECIADGYQLFVIDASGTARCVPVIDLAIRKQIEVPEARPARASRFVLSILQFQRTSLSFLLSPQRS